MSLPVSPLDVFSLLLWGFVVMLAAQRGFLGLILGVLGLLLLRPLLLLAAWNPLVTLVVALLLGLVFSAMLRPFPRLSSRQPRYAHVLGGVGGVLLGGALLLALSVSLPLARDMNGALRYPDPEMPLAELAQSSHLVKVGRAILLYPLLQESGSAALPAQGVLNVLHGLLVVGQPWEEG
jgi:hypothetical protein